MKWKIFSYVSRRNFQNLFFTEDHSRGFFLVSSVRYADPKFGLPGHHAVFSARMTYIYDAGKSFRNETTISRSARKELKNSEQWEDDMAAIENKLFWFVSYGIFALRINYAQGNHLVRDDLFAMGKTYVRGFAYRSKIGDQAYIYSLEYRTLAWLPGGFLKYFAFAGVLFFDYGEVKYIHDDFNPQPVIGFGIRSTIIEFDNTLFRLDFGFPLKVSSFSPENQLSFGIAHVF